MQNYKPLNFICRLKQCCHQGYRSWWRSTSWHLPQVGWALFLNTSLSFLTFCIKYLLCRIWKYFLQQIRRRIFHHIVLPPLAHRFPTLPWNCHLYYQVWTVFSLFPSQFSAFFIFISEKNCNDFCSDYESSWSRQLCVKCQVLTTGCPRRKMRNRLGKGSKKCPFQL